MPDRLGFETARRALLDATWIDAEKAVRLGWAEAGDLASARRRLGEIAAAGRARLECFRALVDGPISLTGSKAPWYS